MRNTIAALAALSTIAILAIAPSAHASKTLTKNQATAYVRTAIEDSLYKKLPARNISCKRKSRTRFTCRASWRSALSRTTASIRIRRTGTTISPIDTWSMRATTRSKYSPTRRERDSGRFVIDTRRAKYGQTLRLLGFESDLEVTPSALIDPLVDPNEFNQPGPGARFVAVTFNVKNVGEDRYQGSTLSSRLITATNLTIDTTWATNCPSELSMAPGEERVACAVFEVPFGARVRQMEFPLGQETGVWR